MSTTRKHWATGDWRDKLGMSLHIGDTFIRSLMGNMYVYVSVCLCVLELGMKN